MQSSPYKITGIFLASLFLLTGCEFSLAQDITPPPNYQRVSLERPELVTDFILPDESPNLSSGKSIFDQSCAPCHGEFGVGGGSQAENLPKPPPLIGSAEIAALSSPQAWYTTITEGNLEALMPPFGESLSVQDLWDVMAYVYSLSDSLTLLETVLPEAMEISALELVETIEPTLPAAATEASETNVEIPESGTPVAVGNFGIVRGKVTHGAGEVIPANLEISLLAFDGFEPVYTLSTTANRDGSFVFENVELAEERIYLTTASYDNANYSSRFDIIATEESELELPLIIYDSTTDNSVLKITWLAIRFEFFDAQTVRMHLFYQVSNPSEETVIAASPDDPVVKYWLPDNAVNFSFEDEIAGDSFVITEGGFGDTSAIIAGVDDYALAFAYDIPYDREISLGQNVYLPVDDLFVFLPKEGPELDNDGFMVSGETTIGDIAYDVFNLSDVAPGTVQIDVSGRNPSAPSGILGLDLDLNIVVSVLVLLSVIVLVWLWVSQNRRGDFAEASNSEVQIIDEIIALDQQFESGFISDEKYQKQREEYKSQLRDQM